MCIHNHVGKTGDTGGIECVPGESGIQYFNCDVLDARAMLCELGVHGWIVTWSDEHHSDSTGFGIDDIGIIGDVGAKAHLGEKFGGCNKIGDSDHYVVNATCNGVKFAALSCAGLFDGRRFIKR
jgi:hypothetical protein